MLIVTVKQDRTLSLFKKQSGQKVNITFLFYTDNMIKFRQVMKMSYDYIYLRDPFAGDELNPNEIKNKINFVLKNKKNAYMIDKINDWKDVFFEDKWIEYKLLAEFMPKTEKLVDYAKINFNKYFIKERLSSRARGIVFNQENIHANKHYIKQEKIDIYKEYRVNTIFDEIIDPVTIKKPKTKDSKIKIIGAEKLTEDLRCFVEKIMRKIKFDFVGYDIARLKDRELMLIEVNRSCLFAGYKRIVGVDLSSVFINKLLNK